jgi:hypothetical protein
MPIPENTISGIDINEATMLMTIKVMILKLQNKYETEMKIILFYNEPVLTCNVKVDEQPSVQ